MIETIAERGELAILYEAMRKLHQRNRKLVTALGPRFDESPWRQMRANDDEIAHLWERIRTIEEHAHQALLRARGRPVIDLLLRV
jgi:hypothetical protein